MRTIMRSRLEEAGEGGGGGLPPGLGYLAQLYSSQGEVSDQVHPMSCQLSLAGRVLLPRSLVESLCPEPGGGGGGGGGAGGGGLQ